MSLLTTICRAGPSRGNGLNRSVVCQEVHQIMRHKSASATPPVNSTPGYLIKRKGKEGPVRRKAVPAFRPLPASQLDRPVLQPKPVENPTKLFEPKVLNNPANVGEAAVFRVDAKDPLRVFGVSRKLLLEFRLLSKPTSVIREVTAATTQLLDDRKGQPSTNTRVVFSGQAGCGKSFLLLQAVEYSVRNKWIVIYIPRADSLVNATTAYTYDIRTQTYLQPPFAFQTLQRMLTVNEEALSSITTQEAIVLEKQTVPAGTPLSQLIDIAIKEKARTTAQAPLILDAVMRTLDKQTQYPVLLAVDDFQALYCKTKYRDPQFLPIASYHLSMPRLIMEYASGKRAFSRGAFFGAISRSDTNFPLCLELRDALQLGYDHPMSPYDKRSAGLLAYTEGLQAFNVPDKLTLNEAASLFEIWKNNYALAGNNYDEIFMSKYTESAGNPRDFVWKGILNSLGA